MQCWFYLLLSLFLGGRQVDGAIPTLLALEMIMKSSTIKAAQSSGKLTIFFDSGIRTGSDIIKALALGAQAVLRKSLSSNSSPLSGAFRSNAFLTNAIWIYKWADHGCTVRSLQAKQALNRSWNILWLIWITLLAWPASQSWARFKAREMKFWQR